MKKKTELQKLRGLEAHELKKRLDETEEEMMKLRFKHASAQLENTASLRTLRKQVARIRTVQQESMQQAK